MVALPVQDRDSVPAEDIIASLQEQVGRKFSWSKTELPFFDYARNILGQTRKIFPNTHGLANSIASDGLYYEPMVVRLDLAGAERYLKELRYAIPAARHRLAQLTLGGDGYFYILIAGERRTRGQWHLYDEGCEDCKKEIKPLPTGACLERHFPGLMMPVILFTDLSADEAVEIQLKENTHEAVREQDEAISYCGLFRMRMKRRLGYSKKQFALDVGRPIQQVRRMLRYSLLPRIITADVEKGLLSYYVAVELARLLEAGLYDAKGMRRAGEEAKRLRLVRNDPDSQESGQTEHYTLEDWIIDAVIGDLTVRQVRKRVTQAINDFRIQQSEIPDLFTQAQVADMRRRQRRQTTYGNTRRALGENATWLEKLLTLYREKRLGQEDSPFSEEGVAEILERIVSYEDDLWPFIRHLLSSRGAERYRRVVDEGLELMDEYRRLGILKDDTPAALEPSLFAVGD